jgi:hypothetical protein
MRLDEVKSGQPGAAGTARIIRDLNDKAATPFSWLACKGQPFRGMLEELMSGQLNSNDLIKDFAYPEDNSFR